MPAFHSTAKKKGPREVFQAGTYRWRFLVLFAIAISLRVVMLAEKGLWLDEAYSVHLAGQSFAGLIEKLSLESTPPLYYFLLRCWMSVFGISEGAVRSLSLLFSLGIVAAIYSLAHRFFGQSCALVSAALAAFSPLQVYYAQEARMYALLALEALLLAGFAMMAVADSPAKDTNTQLAQRRGIFGMGVAGLLMLYTHNVAVWFVAGSFIAALICARDWKARRQLLWSLGGMVLIYLPWLLVVIKQVGRQQTVLQWYVPFWQSKPIWGHVSDTLTGFLFGPFPPYLAIRNDGGVMFALSLLCAAVLVWGIVCRRTSRPLRLCCLIAALSLGFALAYSTFLQPVYIPGRTDFYLQPLFFLLLGAGILSVTKWPGVHIAVMLSYIAVSLSVLVGYFGSPEKNASRSYMQAVRAIARPGDTLIATGRTFAASEYYVKKWRLPVTLFSYPLSLQNHPGFFSPDEGRSPETLADDAHFLAQRMASPTSPAARVIVLLTPYRINDVLLRDLSVGFQISDASKGKVFHEALEVTPVKLLLCEHAAVTAHP